MIEYEKGSIDRLRVQTRISHRIRRPERGDAYFEKLGISADYEPCCILGNDLKSEGTRNCLKV